MFSKKVQLYADDALVLGDNVFDSVVHYKKVERVGLKANLKISKRKSETDNEKVAATLDIKYQPNNIKYLGVYLTKVGDKSLHDFKKKIKSDFSKCYYKCRLISLLKDIQDRQFCFKSHVVSRFRYVTFSEQNPQKKEFLKKLM